ncbi:MAG: restriction endonuclease subunit S [Peptococcaceae bacterium]|nr:restriction endonuclease subunit S [Peptococcaceae bacterium]
MNSIDNNRKIVPLSSIAQIYNGNSINKSTKQAKYTGLLEGRCFIATKDVSFDGVVDYENGVKIPFEETTFKTAPAGSVLVCSEGGSAGRKSAYITQEVCFGNKLYAIVNKNNSFVGKYVYYYTRYRGFFEQFKGLLNGIIGGVSSKNFGSITIPLPSIPEQERIVARIEELFSQLDASVAELQTAKKRLKVYRQAVLKEAFDGKLTDAVFKDIRPIKDFIETPRYGTSKKCSYNNSEHSTPVYRIPNVNYASGRISHDDIKYAVFSESELEGIRLQEGDILIIRSNGSVSLVGRAALIYNSDTKGTFAGYLMRLRIKNTEVLEPKFLLWYLQSLDARVYIENKAKSTSGVHNINSTEIAELQIPLYTHEEQLDIIKSIETRLSVCDSIEQTVDTALQQAEALRQSILKQAFEGKL